MKRYKRIIIIIGLTSLCFADNNFIVPPIAGNLKDQVNNTNSGSYRYFFKKTTLLKVITQVATDNGLTLNISNDIKEKISRTTITGNFQFTSVDEFLKNISQQNGLTFFIYSGSIYICSNVIKTITIPVSPSLMSELKSSLVQEGLLNSKFGWTELFSANSIVVSGPAEYVALLQSRIQDLNISPTAQQYAVYFLKYASAIDLQYNFNNQVITIPGVATILQNIISGKQTNTITGSGMSSSTVNITNGIPLKALSESTEPAGLNQGALGHPSIQADERLNAIIIRDSQPNLKSFRDLINNLDVQTPLIQIELMIVNIDVTDLEQKGINWWSSSVGGGIGFGTNNLENMANSNYYNAAPTLAIATGAQNLAAPNLISNTSSLMSTLQFLSSKGGASVTSRPALVTQDNIPAVMSFSNSYFVNSPSQGVNQVQAQTSLSITPHVISTPNLHNQIKLTVILQDGGILQSIVNAMPQTLQGSINTQAVLKEGQTLIVSGYTHEDTELVTYAVPYLGAIPLLGWLFKNNSTVKKKHVTLYVVIPHILTNDLLGKTKIKILGESFNIQNNMYQMIESNGSSNVYLSNESALNTLIQSLITK